MTVEVQALLQVHSRKVALNFLNQSVVMYAQFSTGLAARAQCVIGVPPSSCLTVVLKTFF